MNIFWRKEPFTEKEMALVGSVCRAHEASTYRHNASTHEIVSAAMGGASFGRGLVGAINSLESAHGPIEATCKLLKADHQEIKDAIALGKLIPGWGNSFKKDAVDEKWEEVDAVLNQNFPESHKVIWDITQLLKTLGKPLFPNPSCYTAATANIIGLPPQAAIYLFVYSRLSAWGHLYLTNQSSKKLWEPQQQ